MFLISFNKPSVKYQTTFNWAAYYKPHSLASSQVGSSSSGGLCSIRRRRT